MMKRLTALTLALILALALAGCGGTHTGESARPGSVIENQIAPAVQLPNPKGVSSVKELLEISLDYFHSDCDYSKIEKYQDPVSYLAFAFLSGSAYRDENLSLAQAREKAALIFTDAETLRARDPRLAELVMEEMNAQDPEEALAEYMNGLRESFRNGDITEENPNYEKLSALLADWDKGADYILEHYPELIESFNARGVVLGLEGAMAAMRSHARLERYLSEENKHLFRELEAEYHPENSSVNENGLCTYDTGYVVSGEGYAWSVDMSYYYEDGLYYLVGYSVIVT